MDTNSKMENGQSSRSGRVRNVPNFAKLAAGEKPISPTTTPVSKAAGNLRHSSENNLPSTRMGAAAEVLVTLAVQSAQSQEENEGNFDEDMRKGEGEPFVMPDWVNEKVPWMNNCI
jgi:hypothetical protein